MFFEHLAGAEHQNVCLHCNSLQESLAILSCLHSQMAGALVGRKNTVSACGTHIGEDIHCHDVIT